MTTTRDACHERRRIVCAYLVWPRNIFAYHRRRYFQFSSSVRFAVIRSDFLLNSDRYHGRGFRQCLISLENTPRARIFFYNLL